MTIGAVAALAGKPASSIRYYEQIGLLPPAPRVSGRRVYGSDTVRMLSFGRSATGSQGAEVIGDRQGVVRVGDQADVSIWAYEDQGVLAVCVCHVPGVVD